MSQAGVQTKTISDRSAGSIVLCPHSQNGGTTRYCDGYLSTFTSDIAPPPKNFGRPQSA